MKKKIIGALILVLSLGVLTGCGKKDKQVEQAIELTNKYYSDVTKNNYDDIYSYTSSKSDESTVKEYLDQYATLIKEYDNLNVSVVKGERLKKWKDALDREYIDVIKVTVEKSYTVYSEGQEKIEKKTTNHVFKITEDKKIKLIWVKTEYINLIADMYLDLAKLNISKAAYKINDATYVKAHIDIAFDYIQKATDLSGETTALSSYKIKSLAYSVLKDYGNVFNNIDAYISMAEKDENKELLIDGYCLKASAYLDMNNYLDASIYFDKALSLDPKSESIREKSRKTKSEIVRLGTEYIEKGWISLDSALKQPNVADKNRILNDDSMYLAEQAIKVNRTMPDGYYLKAHILYNLGDYKNALNVIRECKELINKDDLQYLNASSVTEGFILEALGNYNKFRSKSIKSITLTNQNNVNIIEGI